MKANQRQQREFLALSLAGDWTNARSESSYKPLFSSVDGIKRHMEERAKALPDTDPIDDAVKALSDALKDPTWNPVKVVGLSKTLVRLADDTGRDLVARGERAELDTPIFSPFMEEKREKLSRALVSLSRHAEEIQEFAQK